MNGAMSICRVSSGKDRKMGNKKVWFVTGCSKGLGKALVEELLAQGYPVIGTSRSRESLEKIFGAESGNFLPLAMNVKEETDVKKAVESGLAKFGRIDVAVNNAGFTHLATIEEMSDADAREEFDIHVTDVKPGFMRTEFFGSSYKTTAPEGSPYQHLYDENMEFYMGQNGNQIGDPNKAAKLYIQVAEMENPYESLPMGTDCCDGIHDICADTVKLMEDMRSVAESTNY